jgi:hypothetical protein
MSTFVHMPLQTAGTKKPATGAGFKYLGDEGLEPPTSSV